MARLLFTRNEILSFGFAQGGSGKVEAVPYRRNDRFSARAGGHPCEGRRRPELIEGLRIYLAVGGVSDAEPSPEP